MGPVIAVHGDNNFARRWPTIAAGLGIGVKRVNALGPSLWHDLEGCDALFWNVNHENPTDRAFARSILTSVEERGYRVYPDHRTVWHFDDKVAQKYLLEAIDAPLVESWVFFDAHEANVFLRQAEYPIVFKLRGGASSLNVQLVRDERAASRIVATMFGAGMRPFPAAEGFRRAASRARAATVKRGSMLQRGLRVGRSMLRKFTRFDRERGYVLFQRFIENSGDEYRVVVVGDRAFCFTRIRRDGDFRASGSGRYLFLEPPAIPLDIIDAAFTVARRLGTQSLALDLLRDPRTQQPALLEVSYSFGPTVLNAPGYLTSDHVWVPGTYDPAEFIVRDVLDGLSAS